MSYTSSKLFIFETHLCNYITVGTPGDREAVANLAFNKFNVTVSVSFRLFEFSDAFSEFSHQ